MIMLCCKWKCCLLGRAYYIELTYWTFYTHMSQNGNFLLIVYASICVVVLLCCWMRCTTWIGSFLIYMLVQLCYFMCPCSCGTTICMQYILIIYGMSFVGQPRVAMSNITSSRNCIAYTSSKYFNWRNSYPLVTIRGVQKNDPYQLGPLWQMTPSLGLFIK
jgi:hypothetical protein